MDIACIEGAAVVWNLTTVRVAYFTHVAVTSNHSERIGRPSKSKRGLRPERGERSDRGCRPTCRRMRTPEGTEEGGRKESGE